MRTLYVITHPEATHHLEGIVGGWHDSELSEQGHRDARRTAAELRRTIPAGRRAELFTSDLKRATQTADPIARTLGIEAVPDPRLREKSYGVAEGRSRAWLDEHFRTPPATGDRMNHHEGIEGAETKTQLATRIYTVMEEILAREADHQIIITHGMALSFVVAAFQKLPIEALGHFALRSTPGGITTLREDDHFHNRTLLSLSSSAHLRTKSTEDQGH